MLGIHLRDVIGGSDHRSLSKENVDWAMAATHLPRKAIKVCEIAEWSEKKSIQCVVNLLQENKVAG